MARHYVQMLDAVVRDPGCAAGRVEMLSAAERQQLLYGWNDTATEFPQDKCLHQLFEEQVARTPNAVAVMFEKEELSYAQLNARANQLAHYLRELGVKPDSRVAICVERGLEMVVGLLAVLKAGGAYVPLDPAYPADRLAFMLDDAHVAVLLTQSDLLGRLPASGASVVCLDRDRETFVSESDEDLPGGAGLDNLAYVIYTSGSTGRPKGAMIHHLGLANYLSWCVRAYAVT